jgi:hypothetical protein
MLNVCYTPALLCIVMCDDDGSGVAGGGGLGGACKVLQDYMLPREQMVLHDSCT